MRRFILFFAGFPPRFPDKGGVIPMGRRQLPRRSCHWARAQRRPGQPFLRGILLFSGPRLPGLCLCQIAAQQVALGEGPAHGHAHNVFGVVVGKEAAAAVKSPIPIWIFYSLLTW